MYDCSVFECALCTCSVLHNMESYALHIDTAYMECIVPFGGIKLVCM